MKKTLFMLCAVAAIAFTTTRLFATAGAGMTFCPNSSVKCDVTLTEIDGKTTTVHSEKGKNDDSIVFN